MLLLLMVFTGVAAYRLRQMGLLTRESLDLFVKRPPEGEGREAFVSEPVGLAASVQKKERKLKEKTEELKRSAARLQTQRGEMKSERAMIERLLDELKAKTDAMSEPAVISKEMVALVKIYEGMPPEDAASVLDTMPDATVAQILLQMRGRQAAQIMSSLDADKAAEVSKMLISKDGVKKLSRPEVARAAR